MLKNLIHNWLISGADVEVGLRLFIDYAKPSNAVLRIVSKNPVKHLQTIRIALFKAADIPLDFTAPAKTPVDTTALEGPKNSSIKLRNQWPFLSDPGCPPELKLLISDKITVFTNCVQLYNGLTNVANNEEQLVTASKLVDNFIENHKIYKELKHYLDNKKVLGEHRIFLQYKRIKDLRNLSTMELFNKKRNLENNIWRTQSKLTKGDREDLRPIREAKLKEFRMQLAEVDRLLL
ncbi:hypothetical protein [Sphingobacterium hotanense]|uniref:hypothetical protein n=1 Tax=Sphingobacterium hotanense TaxID=649196 RepID=UPI0011F2E445|nr:hypothetical protein [Sphingobacterium hotanense]